MTELEARALSVTMEVVIRQARYEDVEGLEWYGLFAHLRHLFRRAYNEQQKGRRHMLIADCKGFPVGRLFIQFTATNPQIADGVSRGYLYSFYVMDLFRGNGIGKMLLHEAEMLLLSRGFQWATLAVAKDNPRAMQLYASRGYSIFDESPGLWRYHDHEGILRHVEEPSWLVCKNLTIS